MPFYHLTIRDKFKHVLAEDDIEECDAQSAHRAVAIAVAIFVFTYGTDPGASIELDDSHGQTIARVMMDGKTF